MSDLLTETVIEEFLEDQPRAAYWQELTQALYGRLRDAEASGDKKRAEELRQQVAALAQEAAVTQFVEDSVRASLARPRPTVLDHFDATD
jgi:hypothetical protein